MTVNIIAIISISSLFFIFGILFATLYGIRKRKDLKNAIKDRKDRGENYDDLTGSGIFASWLNIFSEDNGAGKNSLPIFIIICIYIVINIAFARLHPVWFARYWHRTEFFIICQFYVGAIVALMLFKFNGFVKFVLGLVFTIILFTYVKSEWPKPKKDPGGDKVVTTQRMRNYTESRRILAPANGMWSEIIEIPYGYNFNCETDPTYGRNNLNKLIAVLVNDNKLLQEDRTPDGRKISVDDPNAYAKFIRVTCLENTPAYVTVSFIK